MQKRFRENITDFFSMHKSLPIWSYWTHLSKYNTGTNKMQRTVLYKKHSFPKMCNTYMSYRRIKIIQYRRLCGFYWNVFKKGNIRLNRLETQFVLLQQSRHVLTSYIYINIFNRTLLLGDIVVQFPYYWVLVFVGSLGIDVTSQAWRLGTLISH